MSEPTNPALTAELAAFFVEYQEVWNAHEYHLLRDYWDPAEATPVYLAEERDDFVVGWDQLERYFVNDPAKPSSIEAMWMRYRLSEANELAPGVVQVFGGIRHDMKMRGPMKAWGGDARFTAVLRRKPEGWRFVSYTEAHMTPLLYVQRLYEMNVSPEFEDFRRQTVERLAAQAPSEGADVTRAVGRSQ